MIGSPGQDDGPLTFLRLIEIVRNADTVKIMLSNIINFTRNVDIAKGPKAVEQLLGFFKAAVHNHVTGDIQNAYDHRYFFFPDSGEEPVAKPSCGWVREVARSLLFEYSESMHKDLVKNFSAYISAAPNPSARGFAIEAVVLAHIRFEGLTWKDDYGSVEAVLDEHGNRLKDKEGKNVAFINLHNPQGQRYFVFQNGEESSLATQKNATVMYVPRAWNYEAVDCVIRQHSTEKKVVRVVGVQITMKRDPEVSHKASVDKFFRKVKARWAHDLAEEFKAGFEIQYIWIWVEKDGDEAARKSLGLHTTNIGKDTRQKKEQQVTCSVFKVTLGDLSEALQTTVADCYKRDKEPHGA